jgi:NCS1 family nucleobase:cation symporter-1
MLSEVFIVHRKRNVGLNVYQLYNPKGCYWYWKGINIRAIIAFACGLGPNMPGLLNSMGVAVSDRGILNYFSLDWVTSTVISALTYVLISMVWKPVETPLEDEAMTYIEAVEVVTPVEVPSKISDEAKISQAI